VRVPKVKDLPAFARRLGVDVRDAEILLAAALRRDRTWLFAHPETALPPSSAHRVTAQLLRRARGEPLAYITGIQECMGLTFRVTPAVLIPRPETELVVEAALARIPKGRAAWVADVGTGSGCIAVAIAKARPRAAVVATDISRSALAVARANARTHHVSGRVRFVSGDLLAPLSQRGTRFDVVVANLPYLPAGRLPRFEPKIALAAGRDGLTHLRRFLRQLAQLHPAPRSVVLEIDPRNLRGLRPLLPKNYTATVRKDLAGRPRALILTRTN
jgi:release factor glutamine methyltransferase